jgi:glycosyltransferase involved in cell wall biosynthesis
MPIVASGVGGVPELITDETGWLVHDADNVNAYVKALREILAAPDESRRRAQMLKALIESRHAFANYASELRLILETKVS